MESDLDLLLDDPSQRFDTERVHLLLEELRSAASHAQLIIATHEVERFSNLLDQYFSPDQHIVLNFKTYNSDEGPFFERAGI